MSIIPHSSCVSTAQGILDVPSVHVKWSVPDFQSTQSRSSDPWQKHPYLLYDTYSKGRDTVYLPLQLNLSGESGTFPAVASTWAPNQLNRWLTLLSPSTLLMLSLSFLPSSPTLPLFPFLHLSFYLYESPDKSKNTRRLDSSHSCGCHVGSPNRLCMRVLLGNTWTMCLLVFGMSP